MLKSANKTETNIYTLEVSVSGEDFNKAILQAYNKQKNKIQLPGFRKGKAPLKMIEKFYGEGVFYEDALDIVYPGVVGDAIKEAGIEPVAAPHDLDVTKIGKDGVEMTMKVTVKPEISIDNYKGLEADKGDASVCADDVKKELASMQERNARVVTVDDRKAKKNDIAVIDFEGFVDGVAFDGGKGENYELTLGSGQFIPGFEEQIIGHKTGEMLRKTSRAQFLKRLLISLKARFPRLCMTISLRTTLRTTRTDLHSRAFLLILISSTWVWTETSSRKA